MVLFVVDAPSCRAHIDHLTANGFCVSTTTPHSAVARAAALQPDAIVIDCDAVCDVTAILKRHPPTQHIPIIVLMEDDETCDLVDPKGGTRSLTSSSTR